MKIASLHKHCEMKEYGGVEASLYVFLIEALHKSQSLSHALPINFNYAGDNL
jgi:hypothetical protein